MPPHTVHSNPFINSTKTNHIEDQRVNTEQLEHVGHYGEAEPQGLWPTTKADDHSAHQPNHAGEQAQKCHKKGGKLKKLEMCTKQLLKRGRWLKDTAKKGLSNRRIFRKSRHETRVAPQYESTGNLHQSSNLCTEPRRDKCRTRSLDNIPGLSDQQQQPMFQNPPTNKAASCTMTSGSTQSRGTKTHAELYCVKEMSDTSQTISQMSFSNKPKGGNHTEVTDSQKMLINTGAAAVSTTKLPVAQNYSSKHSTCPGCMTASGSTETGAATALVKHSCVQEWPSKVASEKIRAGNALDLDKRLKVEEEEIKIFNSSVPRIIDNFVFFPMHSASVRPHSLIYLQNTELQAPSTNSLMPQSMTNGIDNTNTKFWLESESKSTMLQRSKSLSYTSNKVVKHQRVAVKPTKSFENDDPTTNQLEEINQDEFSSTPYNTKLHCSSQNATVALETEAAVLGVGQNSTNHLSDVDEMVGSNFNSGNCAEKVVKEEGGKDMGAIFNENAVNGNNKSNATDLEEPFGSGQKVDSCTEHQGMQQSKGDLKSAKVLEFGGNFTCDMREERDLEVEKKEAEFQPDACDLEGNGEITDTGAIQGDGDLGDSTDQDSQKNAMANKEKQQENFDEETLTSNNTQNEETLCGNTGNEQLDGSSMDISKPEGPDTENMQGVQSSSDKVGFEDDGIASDNQENKKMSPQITECGFRHHTGSGNQPTGSGKPSGNSKSEGGSSGYSEGAQAAGGGGEATGGCSGSSGGDDGDRGNEKRRKLDDPTDKEDEEDEIENKTEEDPINRPENQISLDKNSTGGIPIVETGDPDELMDEKEETKEDEATTGNLKADDEDTQPTVSKDVDARTENYNSDATAVFRLAIASKGDQSRDKNDYHGDRKDDAKNDVTDNQKPEDEGFQQDDQTNPIADAIGKPQTSSKGDHVKGRVGDQGEREDEAENDLTDRKLEYEGSQQSDENSSNAAAIGRSLDASKKDHDGGKFDELGEQKNAEEVTDNLKLNGKKVDRQTSAGEITTVRSSAVSENDGPRCLNCVPGDQRNEAVSTGYQDSKLTETKSENGQDSAAQSHQYIGASTAMSKRQSIRPSHQQGTPTTSASSLSSGGSSKNEKDSCVPVTETCHTITPEDGWIKRSKHLSISARKFRTELQIEIPGAGMEPSNQKEMKSLDVAYSLLSPTSDCKRTADDNFNATVNPVHTEHEERNLKKNDFPTLNDGQIETVPKSLNRSTLPKIILEEIGHSAGQHDLPLELHSMQDAYLESKLQPGAQRGASSLGNSESLSPMAQATGPQSPLSFNEILLGQKTEPFHGDPGQATSAKAVDKPGVSVEDENTINDTRLVPQTALSNAAVQRDPDDPLAILRPSKEMLAGNTMKGKTAGMKPDQDTEAVLLEDWSNVRPEPHGVSSDPDFEQNTADALAILGPSTDMLAGNIMQGKTAELSGQDTEAVSLGAWGTVMVSETTLRSASDGDAVVFETGPFDRGRLPATTKNKRPPRGQPLPPPAENTPPFQREEETVPHSVFLASSREVKRVKRLTVAEDTVTQHGRTTPEKVIKDGQHSVEDAQRAVVEDQPQNGAIGGSTVKEKIGPSAERIKQLPSTEEADERDDTITAEDLAQRVTEAIISVQEGQAGSTIVQDTTQHRPATEPYVRRKEIRNGKYGVGNAQKAVVEDQPQPGVIAGSTVKEKIGPVTEQTEIEQMSPDVDERDDTITAENPPRSVSEGAIQAQQGEAGSTVVQDTTQHRAATGPSARRKEQFRRQTPNKVIKDDQHGVGPAPKAVVEDQPQHTVIGGCAVEEIMGPSRKRVEIEQSPSIEETGERDDTITADDPPRSVSEGIIPVQEGQAESMVVQDITQQRAVTGPSVRRNIRETPNELEPNYGVGGAGAEAIPKHEAVNTSPVEEKIGPPGLNLPQDRVELVPPSDIPPLFSGTRGSLTLENEVQSPQKIPDQSNFTIQGAETMPKHKAYGTSPMEEKIGPPGPNLLRSQIESNSAIEGAGAEADHNEPAGMPPVEEKIGPPGFNLPQDRVEPTPPSGISRSVEGVQGSHTLENEVQPLLEILDQLMPEDMLQQATVDGMQLTEEGQVPIQDVVELPALQPQQPQFPNPPEGQLESAALGDMRPVEDESQPEALQISKRQYDQLDPGIPDSTEEPGLGPKPLPIIHAGEPEQDAENNMPPVIDEGPVVLVERVLPAPEPQLVQVQSATVDGIQPTEEGGALIPNVMEQPGPDPLPPQILVPHGDQPEPAILMDLPIQDEIEAPELQPLQPQQIIVPHEDEPAVVYDIHPMDLPIPDEIEAQGLEPLQPQENENLAEMAAPRPVAVAPNPIQEQIHGQPEDAENDDLAEIGAAAPHHLLPQQNELPDNLQDPGFWSAPGITEVILEGGIDERECGVCKGQERLGHIHGLTLQFLCPFCYERTLVDENERAFSPETNSLKLHKRVCASCGPLISRIPRPLFLCNTCLKNFCFVPCFLEHRCIPRFFY